MNPLSVMPRAYPGSTTEHVATGYPSRCTRRRPVNGITLCGTNAKSRLSSDGPIGQRIRNGF